jgi:hypothetical protein
MLKDQKSILPELNEISRIVADQSQHTPFEAPEGYFLTFSGRLLQRINSQNTVQEELSPLLTALQKENPFTLPPNYLSEFKVHVATEEAKVVPLFRLKTVLKYAVAASIIGIIATFVTLFSKNEEQSMMAKTTNNEVISSDAYATFLNETAVFEESEEDDIEQTTSVLVQMDANLISEILKEIPENEISTYMDLTKSEDPNMMN